MINNIPWIKKAHGHLKAVLLVMCISIYSKKKLFKFHMFPSLNHHFPIFLGFNPHMFLGYIPRCYEIPILRGFHHFSAPDLGHHHFLWLFPRSNSLKKRAASASAARRRATKPPRCATRPRRRTRRRRRRGRCCGTGMGMSGWESMIRHEELYLSPTSGWWFGTWLLWLSIYWE